MDTAPCRLLSLERSGPSIIGMVGKLRRLVAQRLVQKQVPGRAGYPLLGPDDVADFHGVVVDDIGQVIGRVAVRLQQHEVVDGAVLEDDIAADQVVESGLPLQRAS